MEKLGRIRLVGGVGRIRLDGEVRKDEACWKDEAAWRRWEG